MTALHALAWMEGGDAGCNVLALWYCVMICGRSRTPPVACGSGKGNAICSVTNMTWHLLALHDMQSLSSAQRTCHAWMSMADSLAS